MNPNREIASFPFRPYLAKYLFYSIKGEVIETDEARYRQLDIDLSSPDGKYIRLLFTKASFPNVDKVKKGFRFTISIPNRTNSAIVKRNIETNQNGSLQITDDCAQLINEYFEGRFRDHFHSFVSGYIVGANQRRGAFKEAIDKFCKAYDLNLEDGFDPDKFKKYYQRNDSPLKTGIYDKSSSNNPVQIS